MVYIYYIVKMVQFTFLCLILSVVPHYTAGSPDVSVYSVDTNVKLILHVIPATWLDATASCQLETQSVTGKWIKFNLQDLITDRQTTGQVKATPCLYYNFTDGVLASPTSENVTWKMRAAMSEQNITSSVFTGITSLFSKGEFRSLEGVNLINSSLEWAAGEPNNADNGEDCLAMTSAGDLADVSCALVLPYFCRKQITSDTRKTSEASCVVDGNDTRRNPSEASSCAGYGYQWKPSTGSCYKFHRDEITWRQAMATCHLEGGYLAIINSFKESNVVRELFPKSSLNPVPGSDEYNYYRREYLDAASIGFFKFNGEWITVHGDTLFNAGFDRFSQNEPYQADGDKICGNLFQNGFLGNGFCSVMQPFICEKQTHEK